MVYRALIESLLLTSCAEIKDGLTDAGRSQIQAVDQQERQPRGVRLLAQGAH